MLVAHQTGERPVVSDLISARPRVISGVVRSLGDDDPSAQLTAHQLIAVVRALGQGNVDAVQAADAVFPLEPPAIIDESPLALRAVTCRVAGSRVTEMLPAS